MNAQPLGRYTRTAIHSEAGEAELRMTAAGNWQLAIRAESEREWRLACSGDLQAGASSLPVPAERRPVRVGKLMIDTNVRRAFVEKAEVKLSVKEFGLLAALAADPTRVFSKGELLQSVWGYQANDTTRTLDSHASRLRVTLRRAGAAGFVVNCRAIGYQLLDVSQCAALTETTRT